MIPETTPKVKADEDWNASVRWEPAILFTGKQMGQEAGAGAAWRGREGPLAPRVPQRRRTVLSLHELVSK